MVGEALGDAASASSFLCSADELRFDAPARALATEEALQPMWLYFASSASTRPPVRWRPRRRCSPGGSPASTTVVSVNFAFADFAARPSAIASADCRKTISDRLDLLCRMYF
ncbi:uncharacterized protein [Triticum aestivum]|uniref:uncharacterized protein isoform X4 n=1 Tax=Triticum aestivum TaxID=4565 RepID=UPI001D0121E3|nr:uncharacterized protein LOC123188499 isoform X4 [Triticum aestivum]